MEGGKAKPERFWSSRYFRGYLILLFIYGSVSVLVFIALILTSVILTRAQQSPGLVDTINNVLGPLSLSNLMCFLPYAALIALAGVYLMWKFYLPARKKAGAIAAREKEVKALLADLDEPDSRARMATVKALRTIDLPVVTEALNRVLLSDPSLDVRAETYRSLMYMYKPPVGLIIDRLGREQDKNERLMLILLLQATGNVDQISPLIDLYWVESDRDIRKSILEALGQFSVESVRELAISVVRKDKDEDFRLRGLKMLRWFDDDETVDFLKHLLNDQDDAIRIEAERQFKAQGKTPDTVEIETERRPCPYCSLDIEITNDKCPNCGAPVSW